MLTVVGKVASGRTAAGAIRSLVNGRDLHLECARVLHEALIKSLIVMLYGSGRMISKERERSRIKVLKMGYLRSLLSI